MSANDYYTSRKWRLMRGFDAQDAEEFTPHVCELDFVASGYFGWGLVRTSTLAEGGECCDFRFKRLPRR